MSDLIDRLRKREKRDGMVKVSQIEFARLLALALMNGKNDVAAEAMRDWLKDYERKAARENTESGVNTLGEKP